MKSYVPAYDAYTPKSLDEALKLMREQPGVWHPIAGGTDVMVLLESGKLMHRRFLDLQVLGELRGIHEDKDLISIGALTTFSQIHQNPTLKKAFPALCEAAQSIGAVAVQNRATIGGNIANASPAADSPPALLAYDAELELVSSSGVRRLPYMEFHRDYKKTEMHPDELIRAVILKKTNAERCHYFRKVGTRQAQAISKVCFAGVAEVTDGHVADIRIAIGSVAPTVVRCFHAEDALRGKALQELDVAHAVDSLHEELSPIDDIRSSADYRLTVAMNLLEEFARKLGE